jgi:hypothetical protein
MRLLPGNPTFLWSTRNSKEAFFMYRDSDYREDRPYGGANYEGHGREQKSQPSPFVRGI